MDYPKSNPKIGLHEGKFTDGTEDGTVLPSIDPASWANAVTDEILAVQAAAGLVADEANTHQLRDAIAKLISDALASVPGDMLRRTVNTANLAAGYYITPLALPIVGGVATPVFLDRNLRTIAVDQSFTLANPATIPTGGGARIIATVDATGGRALTLASGYRIIGGEFDGSAGAVNILDMVFGGPGGLIDVQISQRGSI